jgi:hypothetical protein
MRYDNETLLVSPAELAGAAAALGLKRGGLSTTLFDIGGPEQVQAFEDGLLRLDAIQRDIFETALPIVSDPVRSAVVRTYSGGFATVRFLGWNGDGNLAVIEQLGDEIGLQTADAAQVKAELLSTLRADIPFGGSDTRVLLDGQDLFVLVAMADTLRREWLGSLLTHTPASTGVVATDVAAGIEVASANDPRWTSSILSAALPAEFHSALGTVDDSLQRLVAAGVLAASGDGDDAPASYSPTDDAAPLVAGLAGASATVAITVYGMTPDGPGYETTLLARAAETVWTLMISPIESFVASASPSAVAPLVGAALGITPD